jgi:hypothetical protein
MRSGDRLSIFYLAEKEPACVVGIYHRYARYDRNRDGHVSLRLDYGCLEHGCIWTGVNRSKEGYSRWTAYRLTLII